MMMITLFGIAIVTWSLLQGTNELQKIVDTKAAVYVVETNYIAAHNYKTVGRKITKLKVGNKFTFEWKSCKVMSKQIVNYRTQTGSILTGADLYLQTCTDEKDLAYLLKVNCIT